MAAGVAILTAGPIAAVIVAAAAMVRPTAHTPAPVADRTSRSSLLPASVSLGQLDLHLFQPPPTSPPVAAPVLEPLATPPSQDPATASTPRPTPEPKDTSTPNPKLAAQPNVSSSPAAAPGSIEGIIRAAAARHGVSADWMVRIARCESGLNPRAYNPKGPWIGLFQFLASTFKANGGTDIYDPSQQSDITARMLAHGQAHQWGCA